MILVGVGEDEAVERLVGSEKLGVFEEKLGRVDGVRVAWVRLALGSAEVDHVNLPRPGLDHGAIALPHSHEGYPELAVSSSRHFLNPFRFRRRSRRPSRLSRFR